MPKKRPWTRTHTQTQRLIADLWVAIAHKGDFDPDDPAAQALMNRTIDTIAQECLRHEQCGFEKGWTVAMLCLRQSIQGYLAKTEDVVTFSLTPLKATSPEPILHDLEGK